MLNSKQRAFLRKMASGLDATVIIGRSEITDNVLSEINVALDARELVKISILKSADVSARGEIDELASKLNAEPVSAIGNKIVLYRYSKKKGVKHIEFN